MITDVMTPVGLISKAELENAFINPIERLVINSEKIVKLLEALNAK